MMRCKKTAGMIEHGGDLPKGPAQHPATRPSSNQTEAGDPMDQGSRSSRSIISLFGLAPGDRRIGRSGKHCAEVARRLKDYVAADRLGFPAALRYRHSGGSSVRRMPETGRWADPDRL